MLQTRPTEEGNHRPRRVRDTVHKISHVPKRRWTAQVKRIIAASQGWRCARCREILSAFYQIDHISPLFRGGPDTVENAQALCASCHAQKTAEDHLAHLDELNSRRETAEWRDHIDSFFSPSTTGTVPLDVVAAILGWSPTDCNHRLQHAGLRIVPKTIFPVSLWNSVRASCGLPASTQETVDGVHGLEIRREVLGRAKTVAHVAKDAKRFSDIVERFRFSARRDISSWPRLSDQPSELKASRMYVRSSRK